MVWGERMVLFARLRRVGLHPRIQMAFVERLNLTIRQSVSSLSRRTWSYAQTERALWLRLYYHLVRPHESLALPVPSLKSRRHPRSPAMALGVTQQLWTVHDLLHSPVPQVV